MKNAIKATAVALIATVTLGGCATYTGQTNDPSDPNRTRNNALIGAGIGAVAGLLSGGDATERRQRALVGVGVGGLAGGAIGAYQDRQEAELRRQTAGTGIDVSRDGDVIKLNLPDGVTFDFGKANLKSQFYPALDNVASTLAEYNQTIVEVSGHTDSVGSDAANQTLSVQRANSVGNYLIGKGLVRQRFEIVGFGETRPVASNDTDSGRALNRRVEIRVVPLQS
jgi:outer membrane protein OmpA-like peptidoglycan-associated protein